jgi:hypothetical protein
MELDDERIGKIPGGEAFNQNDCRMSHGIYDTEFLGGTTEASEPVAQARTSAARFQP